MMLSQKLEARRCDRLDEWGMDELAIHARLLEDALTDARSGLRYIKESGQQTYGVGWGRVESKAAKALEEEGI